MKINPQLKEELKQHLHNEIRKQKEKVIIFSCYALSQEELQSIVQSFPQLQGREVENKIDQSLIAGLIIQFSSKIIDLSVKSALHTFQKKLYEIN